MSERGQFEEKMTTEIEKALEWSDREVSMPYLKTLASEVRRLRDWEATANIVLADRVKEILSLRARLALADELAKAAEEVNERDPDTWSKILCDALANYRGGNK